MSRPLQLGHMDQAAEKQFGSFVDLPKIAAPFTTIVNRAMVTDFSKDLSAQIGVDIVSLQVIEEVMNETGPLGERVYKLTGDIHDRVRFVGNWSSGQTEDGHQVGQGAGSTDFMEVTFYGTGLNIRATRGGARDIRATVNGGSESGNLFPAALSSIMGGRNYAANSIFAVASGLTPGLQTVRIRINGTNCSFSGMEIVNDTTSISVRPGNSFNGGKKLSLLAASTQSFNSGFETGTLGTRGGRVLVYLKPDGTVGKALTPAAASQSNLAAASHASEVVTGIYNWREFGAFRTTGDLDFSSVTNSSTLRSFTLDDGTTTLAGNGIQESNHSLAILNAGSLFFTFIGTGLDIQESAGIPITTFNMSVDGVTIATAQSIFPGNNRTTKIVSGLAYGTHLLKIDRVSGGNGAEFRQFIVYGPAKPALPEGAVELADYNLLGDFVGATGTANDVNIAAGVVRRNGTRSMFYGGTWAYAGMGFATSFNTAVIRTGVSASFVELVFFGTGFDIRFGHFGTSPNFTLSINGQTNLGTSFPTASSLLSSADGTFAYTSSTGVIAGTGTSAINLTDHMRVSGLPLGMHRVRLTTNNSTGVLDIGAIDVITPVYGTKTSYPNVGAASLIGPNSLSDSRIFATSRSLNIPNWAQSLAITSAPSTTATAPVPLAEMFLTIKTTGNPLQISYNLSALHSAAGQSAVFRVYVDGVLVGTEKVVSAPVAGYDFLVSDNLIVPVGAGTHVVAVLWFTGSGTLTAPGLRRTLAAREL